MELLMIYKISPSPLCQRGGRKGKTFLKKEREKAEMAHSITRRAPFLGIKCEERGVFLFFPQKVEINYHIFPIFVSFFPSTDRGKK